MTTSCPKCKAPLAAGEQFCAQCGYKLQASPADKLAVGERIGVRHAKQGYQQKVQSGRTTILVIAVLILISTPIVYFLGRAALDKARSEIAGAKGNALYDQGKVAEAETAIASAEGQIMLGVILNIVLVGVYFGLWVWAKTKPFPATITALILYLAIIGLNAAIEPASIVQGIIVKIIIVVALVQAVTSAQKFEKLQQAGV